MLQGGAGGQSGSSPLPQPEPLLLLLLLLLQEAHGSLPPLVLLSMGGLHPHQGQGCQGRVPFQPKQINELEGSLGERVGELGDCPLLSILLSFLRGGGTQAVPASTSPSQSVRPRIDYAFAEGEAGQSISLDVKHLLGGVYRVNIVLQPPH